MTATTSTPLGRLMSSPLLHPLNDTAALNELLARANPMWSLDRVKARVTAVIEETADTLSFVLQPNRHWNGHAAGQHVGVEVEIGGVRHRRSYSVSSAPGSRELTITVKRQPGGKVSNWLHDHVNVGDVLTLDTAAGEFVLPDVLPQKLLMLSAGSGITPVMAMLRDLQQRGYRGDVVFLHACRTPADAIFGGELQLLAASVPGLTVQMHYSRDDGRLDAARIAQLVPDYAERRTLLCGPAAFMQSALGYWKQRGLEDSITCEHFTGAFLQREPGEAVQAQIAFARSERVIDSQGAAPLLDEAEAAGLKPRYGCRIGICHTCKCKKLSGTVENLLTGQVSSEPGEMIQLCVSAARSDVTLDL